MNLRNVELVPNPAVRNFNAAEYWADKPLKKWVVRLERQSRGRAVEMDTKIVAARTQGSAKKTAIANSFINPTHIHSVRLATPIDLGCTQMVAVRDAISEPDSLPV
jgi:hypothetical protein